MADLDIAAGRALTRYSEAHQSSPDLSTIATDPEFLDMVAEELSAIESERASGAGSDSGTVGCPVPHSPPTTEPCNFTELVVNKLRDGDRVYHSNTATEHVLELVAGRSVLKAHVQFQQTAGVGPCGTHNNHSWDVAPHATIVSSTNAELNADLVWRGNTADLGFFNSGIAPTSYQFAAHRHGNSKIIQVRIYPDYAWSGTVTLSTSINPDNNHIEFSDASVVFTRVDDGQTQNLGGSITEFFTMLRRFYNFLQGVKEIADFVSQGTVTWQPVPPSFNISINSRWQENTANLRCGYYINFSLGFTPLIGLQLTIVLSNIAIAAIPYIGPLIIRAAGSRIREYVAITFTVTGTIGGTFNYAKSVSEPSGHASGSATGQLQFDFQIRGQINRDFAFVIINCGVRAGARGSVTVTGTGPVIDSQGMYLQLGATFDGLTLYAGIYCRAGTSRDTRTESSSSAPGASDEETYPWVEARDLIDPIRLRL